MVKADVRRDYYADLGLTPGASSDDIKRSFRKLALKFHPDRNPGREVEFNSKFQAIQAAHEILSDPQQRDKYDIDRLRAGYGRSYAPPKPAPRRPPPAQAAPPPPRPPKAPQGPSPKGRPRSAYAQWTGAKPQAAGPSAGSQRYSTHARAGPQNWQNPNVDAQTRADAFKGFTGMRGSTAGWHNFDPQTGQRSQAPSGNPANGIPRQQAPFGAPRPKSAYETFKEQHSSSPNSAKKKQGYAPGNAAGDEPPARNTSAYTHNRSDRPSTMYFESAPPPTARMPPPAPEPPQFPEGLERNRRGYAATGGERISVPLGRSASARAPSASAAYRPNSRTNPPSPDDGHRDGSPKPRRNTEAGRKGHYKAADDWTSSSDLDESEGELDAGIPRAPQPKPKAIPKSRLRAQQNLYEFHGIGNPAANPATGENPFFNRQRTPYFFIPPSGPSGNPERPPSLPDRFAAYSFQTRSYSSTPYYYQTNWHHQQGHNSDSAAFARGPNIWQQRPQSQGSHSREENPTQGTDETTHSDFGKANGLHKKFSAEDWRVHFDQFDFLGASAKRIYSARASPKTAKSRSQTSLQNDSTDSVPSSNSPGLNTFGAGFGNVPQPAEPQPQQSPTHFPFAQAKFSADEWSKQLHDLQWDAPDSDTTRKSANTPPTRNPKKQARTGTKVRSAPKPASVASEVDEANHTVNPDEPASMPSQPAPPEAEAMEAEAMDIDDELPTSPDKPEPEAAKNAAYPNLNSNMAQEATAAKPQQPQTEPDVSKEKMRVPLFDLNNLRNAAPFTTTNNSGIENLEDVHATLPFESGAKKQTTTERDIRPRELNIPKPPKRPSAPALVNMGPNLQVLPIDKWRHYLSAMSTYIHDWNSFNRRMLLHFNTRQEAVQTGLSPNWMSGVGDTTRLNMGDDDTDATDKEIGDSSDADDFLVPGSKKGGFSAYLRGIEEDTQVRKHWEVACELHRDCILELGRLRQWIRNGGKLVSFSAV